MTDEELLARAVANCRPRKTLGKQPRWMVVADLMMLGSTASILLCGRFRVDPDELISAQQ